MIFLDVLFGSMIFDASELRASLALAPGGIFKPCCFQIVLDAKF